MVQVQKKVRPISHGEIVKSFAIGIALILVTLFLIELVANFAPSIYGDAEKTIQQWGVPGVFAGVLLGSTVLPFPTDLFYLTAVRLASNSSQKLVMVGVAIVAAFLGSLLNYGLALLLREKFVAHVVSQDQVNAAKEWFDKYGPFPILIFGVLPASPIFDPITFVAGLTGMDFKQFALYSLVSRFLHFSLIALFAGAVALG